MAEHGKKSIFKLNKLQCFVLDKLARFSISSSFSKKKRMASFCDLPAGTNAKVRDFCALSCGECLAVDSNHSSKETLKEPPTTALDLTITKSKSTNKSAIGRVLETSCVYFLRLNTQYSR